MTNGEMFQTEIMGVLFATGKHPALIGEEIVECHRDCRLCNFNHTKHSCDEAFMNWAEKPCEMERIDWEKVPVDTKIAVKDSDTDTWRKYHFCRYDTKESCVYAFEFSGTSWTRTSAAPWKYANIPDPEERKKYLKNE